LLFTTPSIFSADPIEKEDRMKTLSRTTLALGGMALAALAAAGFYAELHRAPDQP